MDNGSGNLTYPDLSATGEIFLRSDIHLHLFLGILILYILFSIDIITTEAILLFGGVELNHLMTAVVACPMVHIIVKGGVLIYISGTCTWAEEKVAWSGTSAMALIIAFYVIVALHNTGALWLMTQAG